MPLVLILSSHVAASAVGGGAQLVVLARRGIETILAPTVLFGRHPGLGSPGGGAVAPDLFESLLEGVGASGALERVDAVITGYFADPRQVALAAGVIDRVRANGRSARIVVDPIMGDHPKGLYVREDVAAAIAGDLISRADLVAPNAWELARLTGGPIDDPVAAARALGRPVMLSSIDVGDDIGVLYADSCEAWRASHRRLPSAPNGTGDRLAAHFLGELLAGLAPSDALDAAVRAVAAEIMGYTPVVLERLEPPTVRRNQLTVDKWL